MSKKHRSYVMSAYTSEETKKVLAKLGQIRIREHGLQLLKKGCENDPPMWPLDECEDLKPLRNEIEEKTKETGILSLEDWDVLDCAFDTLSIGKWNGHESCDDEECPEKESR